MWILTHIYASQAGVSVGCVAELVSLNTSILYISYIQPLHILCIQALELTIAYSSSQAYKPFELTVAYSSSQVCLSPVACSST